MAYSIAHGTGVESFDRQQLLDRQQQLEGSNLSMPANGVENGGGIRHGGGGQPPSPFPEGAGAPIYPTREPREEAPLNGGRGSYAPMPLGDPLNGGRGSYAPMPLDALGHSGGMHESRRRAHLGMGGLGMGGPGMGGHAGHLQHAGHPQHSGGAGESPDRRQMHSHQQMQASRVTTNPPGRPKSTHFDVGITLGRESSRSGSPV